MLNMERSLKNQFSKIRSAVTVLQSLYVFILTLLEIARDIERDCGKEREKEGF